MNHVLQFVLAITCAIPAAAGLLFFRRIDKRFHPLIYILLLAVVTEALQEINKIYIKAAYPVSSIAPLITNVFLLINTLLYLWLFYNIGVIKNKKVVLAYFTFFILVYIGNGEYKHSMLLHYELVLIVSNIIIMQLCIKGIVLQTFKEYIWREDGLFLYFAINIIYSAFVIFTFSLRFEIRQDSAINQTIAYLHNYINAACYLLTLWAVLCLRKKRNYS